MLTNRLHFRAPGLLGLATCLGILLMFPGTAQAVPLNVLTVDCTPFVSPNLTSFGPDNTMGMSLQQVDPGATLFAVTEVTPAAFRAMTAAQLSAFNLIAINNNPTRIDCGSGLGLGTIWHSVIGIANGGRIVLNSHDAARFKIIVCPGCAFFGAGAPGPGVEPFGTDELVRDAALWAGGGSRTGLLMFNDSARFFTVGGVGWDNPELNLPLVWGISDLDQTFGGPTDGGYTKILPAFTAHPIYASLTDARFGVDSIGSFAANIADGSFHSIFGSFNPAIFTMTEAVTNSGLIDIGGFNAMFGIGGWNSPAGPDGAAISLIRDEEFCEPDPSTQGYWHRQCLGAGLITPGRNGRGPQTVLEPDFTKTLVPAVDLRLQATIFSPPTFLTCEDGIDTDPPSDKCEKALKQFTALLLNLESDRLQVSCGIDLSMEGCASTTIDDLLNELAALINSGDPDECRVAAGCAGAINENMGITPFAFAPTGLSAFSSAIGAGIDAATPATTQATPASGGDTTVSQQTPTTVGGTPMLAAEIAPSATPDPVKTTSVGANYLVPFTTEAHSPNATTPRTERATKVATIDGHLAIMKNASAPERVRKASTDALLTALGGGYEPAVRLQIVRGLLGTIDVAYNSLLAKHLGDIRTEAREFGNDEIARKVEELLKRLEAAGVSVE